MEKSIVIIPTYNERDNIVSIIEAILSQGNNLDVLVVDDNSPDGTADLVAGLRKLHSARVFLIRREGKMGLGTAYITGFRYGLERGYERIIEMDADFSHDPDDLLRLIAPCLDKSADLCIGSRYVNEGKVQDWPWQRIFLSKGASLYVRLLSHLNIMDPTSGFKCYNRTVLKTINLDKIQFVGYAFQIEMKYAAKSLGFKLVEIPIVFKDRVRGQSKMNLSIVREAIWGVIKMKVNTLLDRNYYAHP